ncbi:hypothetical protein B484DRAFT_445251 [Ochromonadaceae sp. CCMP2298]|nr:hypothetical protein B484DRAFT_445251 [Ochromonadaceae sp. CCMP2298]|mmetsp:Transcript_11506/g.25548  ORF Transcript_11506/g.25548 Transcript_11506/m.25548 type:complete len:120 (-) Transcript_11506:2746-3105(-)
MQATVRHLFTAVARPSLRRPFPVARLAQFGTSKAEDTSVKELNVTKTTRPTASMASMAKGAPGPDPSADPDDPEGLNEWEEMFIEGPAGIEWNGPTRGGQRPEPTRFGDWERKGRCTDF